jgi:hypothetical protein
MCSAHDAIVARRAAGPARGDGDALSCEGAMRWIPPGAVHPVHSTRVALRNGLAPKRAPP